MATVIAVLDRDDWGSNTDVLVLAQPDRRVLTWIPRDLWCPEIRHRINKAYARGSFPQMLRCLRASGFHADHGICLLRSGVGRAMDGISVRVPVATPLRLWYPLTPEGRLQDGKKPVDFDPPSEILSGERIHQWIGARRSRVGPSSDLERIARQQTFVLSLLEQGFDFRRAIEHADLVRMTGPDAIAEVSAVTVGWSFETYDDLVSTTIDGMAVLVPTGA